MFQLLDLKQFVSGTLIKLLVLIPFFIILFIQFEQGSASLTVPSHEENIRTSNELAGKICLVYTDFEPNVPNMINILVTRKVHQCDFNEVFFSHTVIGNQFASSGNFDSAVIYFTEAIKRNPREVK